MDKKYLFITQSDLADTDSNGRTLRDVFGYVDNSNIYSFCTIRHNEKLSASQTFCIEESRLFKRKMIHQEARVQQSVYQHAKIKKNPLTCLLRNMFWDLSYLGWKKKYKKWLLSIRPDVIVFNPGDFKFMHKLAFLTSKLLNKQLVIYNTEDYYFKTWNYMPNRKSFNCLYCAFRKSLLNGYKKSFNCAKLIIHNTDGLCKIYKEAFPSIKQLTIYHPSNLISKGTTEYSKKIYYCGALDDYRIPLILDLAKMLEGIDSSFMIELNGAINDNLLQQTKHHKNIVYKGLISYEEVKKNIVKNSVLLSLNPIDDFNRLDRQHAFSTKLADYIASFNIIFHVSAPSDEMDVIKRNNLGYASSTLEEMRNNLIKLIDDVQKKSNPFKDSMIMFYNKFLNATVVCEQTKKEVE